MGRKCHWIPNTSHSLLQDLPTDIYSHLLVKRSILILWNSKPKLCVNLSRSSKLIKYLLSSYLTWKFSLLRRKSFLWLPVLFTYFITNIKSFKQKVLGRTCVALLLRSVSVFTYYDDGNSLGVITVQSRDLHSPTISTRTHYPHINP